jgi:hypothetical protein
MRPTGLRTEDLLLAAWNAFGVPLVLRFVLYIVSALLGIGWLAVAAG